VGNPGSIEKVMVFGILVIILGILGIAIWSREADPNSPASAFTDNVTGQVPMKPPGPSGSDDPGRGGSGGSGSGGNGIDDASGNRPFVDGAGTGDSPVPAVDEIDWDESSKPIDVGSEDPPALPPEPVVAPPVVEEDPPAPTSYTVKSGDTLEKIARDLLGDRKHVSDIVKANPGLKPEKIFAGQVLKLPTIGKSTASEKEDSSSTAPKTPADATKPKTAVSKVTNTQLTHTIQPGDNLVKISKKYYNTGLKVNAIIAANKDVIKDPNNLPVGKTIKLPSP